MIEDRIISALIGLVGACSNNPKTADTDSLVIKALAFPIRQEMAAHVSYNQESGIILYIDTGFFYKALSYVSYDLSEAELLGLLNEAENIL